MLSLHSCARAFSSCNEPGQLFVVVHRLRIAVASLVLGSALRPGFSSCNTWTSEVAAYGLQKLQHVGSAVVAPGLSFSVACGIFLDQGSNLCPPH